MTLTALYKKWRALLQRPGIHRFAAPIYRKGKRSPEYLRRRLTALLKGSVREADEGPRARLFRKLIWSMNRSYRPTGLVQIERREEFADILGRIAAGEPVAVSKLLPFLCLESRDARAEVNAHLADAFAQREDGLREARVFIERAWILSGGTEALLPLYTRIFSALGETARIREAYKRLGMQAAARRDISEAIHYFTQAHKAYAIFENLDRFEFDPDILSRMDELAAPFRFHQTPRVERPRDGKIRLAHLVKGATELNSILVAINLVMAKFYDRTRFEVAFFIPETEREVAESPQGREHVKGFEALGWPVEVAPNLPRQEEILLALARKIHDFRPHILITSAALVDYRHYFVTSLRPAPVLLGLVQGPPAQFAPPILDWSIGWSQHPLMDTPVDCTFVDMKLDYPVLSREEAYSRKELGLPETACVLLSGGRSPKFQSAEFWQAIAELLSTHAETYYVVVGPFESELPLLDSVLPKSLRPRLKLLGWREDFLKILPSADVLIDTYPNGGGQVIVQAMAHGIPFVSHRNDFMKLFDQTSWNPVEDFITDDEIIVARGDFGEFKRAVSRLIEDTEYRAQVAERCRAAHLARRGPERAVRQCEEVYTRVLEMFSGNG